MDHALLVCRRQRVRKGDSDFKHFIKRQSAGEEETIQGLAVHQLHGQEMGSFRFFHGVVVTMWGWLSAATASASR